MQPSIAIINASLVTGVGLNLASCGAAILSSIDNFHESNFSDANGEPLISSEIDCLATTQGTQKLLELATLSLTQCIHDSDIPDLSSTPLYLCLPETGRVGRNLDDDGFFELLEKKTGVMFGSGSRVLDHGHTAVAVALKHARTAIGENHAEHILVCGVDSYLSQETLHHYEQQERLLTSLNSNGFVPGEAAATLLISRVNSARYSGLMIEGLGFGMEKAFINSQIPLRADALKKSIDDALLEAQIQMHQIDYRLADMTGEHYYFKEASLALARTLRGKTDDMDLLHLTDCIGETGCVAGVALLAYQFYLTSEKLSVGNNVLCHLSDTDGKRGAIVMQST